MVLVAVTAAACGKAGRSDAPASDPDRPAVVVGPRVVLPSDTAHPDTMPAYRERMEDLKRRVSEWHGFVGAMVVFGDRKVLLSYYAPSATVRIADTTLTGAQQIANGLVDLGRRTSIREFLRAPYRVHATDSVAVDSGTYGILMQREGGPRREERGTYVTTWHRTANPQQPWVILRDVLKPDPTGKAGKPPEPQRPAKAPARGKVG
jgi:hypothetical protein